MDDRRANPRHRPRRSPSPSRADQSHGFANLANSDATFLAVATPGVFGPAYFREIGEVFEAAQGGPPDLAAIGEVMRRHGLTPAQAVAT